MTAQTDPPLGAARHLAGFDGLRAIAVTAVMAYHFFLIVPVFPETQSLEVGLQLRVGVWIFFAISGFLLYRPHAVAHAGGRTAPRLEVYAWSRFLRIWPAYAVALVVMTFVWHVVRIKGVGNYLANLGLLHNYFPADFKRGIGPTWSLVIEVAFYAFLPVYAAAIRWFVQKHAAWKVECAGLLLLFGAGAAWQVTVAGHPMLLTLLPSFLPAFGIGIGLAVAVVNDAGSVLAFLARRAWLCLAAAAGLLTAKGLIGGFDGFEDGFRLPNQILYVSIAFLVVLPVVFGRRDARYLRVLESRPFRTVGVVSYGMFLWSAAVTVVVQREWIPHEPAFFGRSAVVAIVVFLTTFTIAAASWFVVERPALRLKRVRRGVRDPHAAVATPVPERGSEIPVD